MMKHLFLIPAIAILAGTLSAQTFSIQTTPRSLTKRVGETAMFSVRVIPRDGYDASVFFRASVITLNRQLTLQPDLINAPYTSTLTLPYTPLPGDIGVQTIVIEAWNGPLRTYDTVTVRVDQYPDNPGWTRLTTGNSGLPSDTITALEFDTDGNAWIGTPNGLAKYDGKEWTIFRSQNDGDSSLLSNNIWSLAVDSSNVIWVGTARGISRRANNQWNSYRRGRGFPGSDTLDLRIISMATTSDLKIYAFGQLLNERYQIQQGQLWQKVEEEWLLTPTVGYVSDIASDSRGRIYVLGQDSLVRIDGDFRTLFLKPYQRQFGAGLAIDQKDRIWTTIEPNLLRLEQGEWKTFLIPGERDYTLSLTTDRNDAVWVTHSTLGVRQFDGTSWKVYNVSDRSHFSSLITVVRAHRNGTIWGGTYGGGLLILKPDDANTSSVTSPPARMNNAQFVGLAPNPTSGALSIQLRLNSADHVHITLVNVMGEVVADLLDARLEQGSHVLQVDAGTVGAGAYHLRVSHSDGIESLPVIVVR